MIFIVIITFYPKKYLLILYYFLIYCYNKIKLTIINNKVNIDFDGQSRLNQGFKITDNFQH